MPPPYTSIMMAGAGAIGQTEVGSSLPTDDLQFQLDGSLSETFWQDSSRTTQAVQNDAVGAWEDISGNGNHWIQTNASYKPIAQPNNSRLHNNGNNNGGITDHLTGPNMSGWPEATFIARCYVVSSAYGAIWGITGWNNQSSLAHWNYGGTRYVNFGTDQRPSGGSPDTAGAWITFEQSCTSAGVVTIRVNGVATYGPTDLGNKTFRTVPYLGCGVRNNSPEYSLNVYFHRVLGYSKILGSNERTLVNAWLEELI